MLVVEFMLQGTRVTPELYCETLKKSLQNKRCGMLTYGVVLLPDSVHPHTAADTQAVLEHFNWKLFDHPPYSPDLTQSNYHLFLYLKNWLGSQRFNSNEELVWKVSKRG
jgi:hypothetical protein